jgi:protein phosphatase 2C-like protein
MIGKTRLRYIFALLSRVPSLTSQPIANQSAPGTPIKSASRRARVAAIYRRVRERTRKKLDQTPHTFDPRQDSALATSSLCSNGAKLEENRSVPLSPEHLQTDLSANVGPDMLQELLLDRPQPEQIPADPHWLALASTAVGASHLRLTPPVPCQDASIALAYPRPVLIVADGVGSARLSHLGADAVVRMVSCFIEGSDDLLTLLLDSPDAGEGGSDGSRAAARFSKSICRFSASVLRDTASRIHHNATEVQSTLLLAIVGLVNTFWLQIGDGAIVIEDGIGLRSLSPTKGAQFANVVTVISEAEQKDAFICGLIGSNNLKGIALFTDGAAERLISADHSRIAAKVRTLFQQLRSNSLQRTALHAFLSAHEVWSGTTGDDKSIALLARTGTGPLSGQIEHRQPSPVR